MTRTAAIMIGFVLAALSIALNVVRYPVVWEMAGPAGANETAQPSAASPPEKPESLSPARPPEPAPAAKTEARLMPDAAEASAVDKPAGYADSTADASPASSGAETRRPLVPVVRANSSVAPQAPAEIAAGVSRLPAVDRAGFDRAGGGALAGPNPAYPSTGIP
jgi:hypothetical protein